MMVIPVKVKWMALITWLFYIYQLCVGTAMDRVLVLAAVGNFLLFFWKDLLTMARVGNYKMRTEAKRISQKKTNDVFHTCIVCGANDRQNPNLEFRYCSDCVGAPCYCLEHLEHHIHRVPAGS
jgi:hypothetical protein